MRLEQLEYIAAIADTGSFTAASERLFIAQPSISQSITSLEKELNVTLFQRSRNGAFPTSAGEQVVACAKRILKEIGEIRNICESDNREATGVITVHSIPAITKNILPKAISHYRGLYPNVVVHIKDYGSKKIKENILSGEAEIGIVAYHDKFIYKDPVLTLSSLITGRLMACVGASSPLANRKEVGFDELIHYPIMLYSDSYLSAEYVIERLQEHGEPNVISTSSNSDSVMQFVMECDAVGFAPDISLINDIYVRDKLIVPIPLSDPQPTHFGILTNKTRYLSPLAKALSKEILSQADYYTRVFLRN